MFHKVALQMSVQSFWDLRVDFNPLNLYAKLPKSPKMTDNDLGNSVLDT